MNMIRCLAGYKFLWCVVRPHGCPCGWQPPNMVNVAPTSTMSSARVLYVPRLVSCMHIIFPSHGEVLYGCLPGILWACQIIAACWRWSCPCEWRGWVSWCWLLATCILVHRREGQCKLRHADEERWEVWGSNCDQGIGDWEANLDDQGKKEAERREAKRKRVFVEGKGGHGVHSRLWR